MYKKSEILLIRTCNPIIEGDFEYWNAFERLNQINQYSCDLEINSEYGKIYEVPFYPNNVSSSLFTKANIKNGEEVYFRPIAPNQKKTIDNNTCNQSNRFSFSFILNQEAFDIVLATNQSAGTLGKNITYDDKYISYKASFENDEIKNKKEVLNNSFLPNCKNFLYIQPTGTIDKRSISLFSHKPTLQDLSQKGSLNYEEIAKKLTEKRNEIYIKPKKQFDKIQDIVKNKTVIVRNSFNNQATKINPEDLAVFKYLKDNDFQICEFKNGELIPFNLESFLKTRKIEKSTNVQDKKIENIITEYTQRKNNVINSIKESIPKLINNQNTIKYYGKNLTSEDIPSFIGNKNIDPILLHDEEGRISITKIKEAQEELQSEIASEESIYEPESQNTRKTNFKKEEEREKYERMFENNPFNIPIEAVKFEPERKPMNDERNLFGKVWNKLFWGTEM